MAEAVVKKTSKIKGIGKFFKDTRQELKKVIWPNRKQLINNTLTVLAFCLIVGAVVWGFDATIKFFIANRFFK